jgi:hypothetical protein
MTVRKCFGILVDSAGREHGSPWRAAEQILRLGAQERSKAKLSGGLTQDSGSTGEVEAPGTASPLKPTPNRDEVGCGGRHREG